MKSLVVVLCLFLSSGVYAQVTGGGLSLQKAGPKANSPMEVLVEKSWDEFKAGEREIVQEVVEMREALNTRITESGEKGNAKLLNAARAVSYVADFLKAHPDDPFVDRKGLKLVYEGLDVTSPAIARCPSLMNVIDNYYALKAIGEGTPVGEAWGAMRYNLIGETLGTAVDYRKYREILELNNPALMVSYLECIPRAIENNGYTKELWDLRPLIEKNMPEGKLKGTILTLFEEYYPLRVGEPAPLFWLKDYSGTEYSLEDFRGKVLVVDVWATWCSGCIKKLPGFMKMKAAYEDREDIEFITISIDAEGSYSRWRDKVVEYGLTGVKNLFASGKNDSLKKDYKIVGIPRYLVIDREGRIVSVYTPTSGPLFKEMIEGALGL